MTEQKGFEGWALVEQMGHKSIAGHVSEVQLAGVPMLRVDVPGQGDEVIATQFIHASTLYALTPMAEDMVRRIAARTRVEPPATWGVRQLPAGGDDDFDPTGDDEEESDEEAVKRILAELGLPTVLRLLYGEYADVEDPDAIEKAEILDKAMGALEALTASAAVNE